MYGPVDSKEREVKLCLQWPVYRVHTVCDVVAVVLLCGGYGIEISCDSIAYLNAFFPEVFLARKIAVEREGCNAIDIPVCITLL